MTTGETIIRSRLSALEFENASLRSQLAAEREKVKVLKALLSRAQHHLEIPYELIGKKGLLAEIAALSKEGA